MSIGCLYLCAHSMESFASMHQRDRYAAQQMDWRALRRELTPIIREQEGLQSMREIKAQTGVAPSTLVRWKEESDDPVDLNTVVKVLEHFGHSLADFFGKVEVARAGTNPAIPQTDSDTNGSGNPVRRRPLDDTNAIIAANSSAIVRLARSVEELSTELRAAREQAATARAAPPGRAPRNRAAGR